MRASVRRTGWTVALAGRAPLALAMLIAIVASQMADPSATLGSSLLVASALPPFAGVALSMVDLARTSAARAKLDALLGTPASPAGSASPPSHPATLEFKNLSCAYGNRPPAIEDLTLRWTCSHPLVLAGPTTPARAPSSVCSSAS